MVVRKKLLGGCLKGFPVMSVKRNGSKGATRGRNVNPENAKRKALYSQPSWKISRSKK